MKIVLKTLKDEIVLKNCRSYVELDGILTKFASLKEIAARLDFDEDEAMIQVLDNNGNQISYSSDAIRKTLSFFEQDKGDEFVDWIYESSAKSGFGVANNNKLHYFFLHRLEDFINDEQDPEKNAKNPEGNRLHGIIKKVIEKLDLYGSTPELLFFGKREISPLISDYVKRNGKYDYAYMRKFVSSLINFYDYKLDETNIKVKEVTLEDQDKVLKDFKTTIRGHLAQQRQVTFDDILLDEPIEEKEPIYDENGIKLDEKEFLEEFAVKKNLHL